MPKWRYMLFGYPVNEEWLLWYGNNNNCVPPPSKDVDPELSTVANALDLLVVQAGLRGSTKIRQSDHKGESKIFIALATDNYADGIATTRPPPEKWQKLKEILKAKSDPAWHWAYEEEE